ncbi:MAG: hypothetical protein AAGJ79_11485 [Verrucomicrobiota bacterium]
MIRINPLFILLAVAGLVAADEPLPVVHADDFESGASSWHPSQPSKWKVSESGDQGKVYHLLGKSGAYVPPVRSPHSVTLLKDTVVGDFVLTAKVKTLQTTRGHRDMCIFFGYQDPAHFYYVHLGEKADPHSSQIFIVNNEPRMKITESEDIGIPWKEDTWHEVKVVRRLKDGLIEVYFDDMKTPQKVAHDKTFGTGLIGLGSFDDLGQWDDIELRGVEVTPAEGEEPELFEPAEDDGKSKGKKK